MRSPPRRFVHRRRSVPVGSLVRLHIGVARPAGARHPVPCRRTCRGTGRTAVPQRGPRTDRQIAQQLDVHDPEPPRLSDQSLRDVPTDTEVHVQSVTARMPLRRPQVGKRFLAQTRTQRLEERAHVPAKLDRIEATRAGVRKRPKAIQPIRDHVPAELRARSPHRLRLGTLRIGVDASRPPCRRNDKAAACLRCLRIQIQRPRRTQPASKLTTSSWRRPLRPTRTPGTSVNVATFLNWTGFNTEPWLLAVSEFLSRTARPPVALWLTPG